MILGEMERNIRLVTNFMEEERMCWEILNKNEGAMIKIYRENGEGEWSIPSIIGRLD